MQTTSVRLTHPAIHLGRWGFPLLLECLSRWPQEAAGQGRRGTFQTQRACSGVPVRLGRL